jgi:hypothetical protein
MIVVDSSALMVKTLEQAIAQISRLADADQKKVSRNLLSHVEKLNTFRGEIDKGINSLEAGKGSALNVEDFLREKNSRDGGAQASEVPSEPASS